MADLGGLSGFIMRAGPLEGPPACRSYKEPWKRQTQYPSSPPSQLADTMESDGNELEKQSQSKKNEYHTLARGRRRGCVCTVCLVDTIGKHGPAHKKVLKT